MKCKTKHKKISHGGPYETKDVYLTNISRPVSSMFLLMAFHDCLSLKTSLVDIPKGLKVLEISETLANSPPLTERAEGLTLQASALLWALTTLVFRQPISCQRRHSTMAHTSQSNTTPHRYVPRPFTVKNAEEWLVFTKDSVSWSRWLLAHKLLSRPSAPSRCLVRGALASKPDGIRRLCRLA